MRTTFFFPVVLLPLLTVLVSCGGDGGGGDDPFIPVVVTTLQVTDVHPEDGALLLVFPQQIRVTFNRELVSGLVNENTFKVIQSGGDGNFGSGNETELVANSIGLSGTAVTLDFTGTNLPDDVYQILVSGEGASPVTGPDGEILDGDADGVPGGSFISTFSVNSTAPDPATFSQIQLTILTPNCTSSECHSGIRPPEGLNLTAGQSYGAIVGIASSQVPSLQRVEPGNPDRSYLVQKIEGTATVGVRMPTGLAPLSDAQIANIREWISQGAMDN